MIFKTFEEFLLEKLIIPNLKNGLNKRRHTLPQVRDFDQFKEDLKSEKISISPVEEHNPRDLTPTQSNFNEEKVEKMISGSFWDEKPIVISNDDYVIDGHHRWLAAVKLKKNIKACTVDLSAEELLQFLKGKSYVEKNTINQ